MPVTAVPSPTGHPAYSDTFRCVPESVADARDLVRTALLTWSLGDCVDDGVVVVSELVTNSIQHAACRTVRVTVTRLRPGLVRIEAVDRSRLFPVPCMAKPGDTCGRGLTVVERLSVAWGTEPVPSGKRVWAELARPVTGEVTSR